MDLTISLTSAVGNALSEEASARNTTCEQIVRDMLEAQFCRPSSPGPQYEAWFKARYVEGKAAYERGDVCSHEEVQRDMALRRARYLERLSKGC